MIEQMFCIVFDLIMAIIFILIGKYFYDSNGKASKYLSGYNSIKESEKKGVDENKITKVYGKIIMIMAIPFVIAVFIDIFKPIYGLIFAWIIWALLFIYLLINRIKKEKIDNNLE